MKLITKKTIIIIILLVGTITTTHMLIQIDELKKSITNSTDITQLEKDIEELYKIKANATDVNQLIINVNQANNDIASNSDTIILLNNTVNQLTVRINELTVLHYPSPIDVLVPPVPELVPLPEQPLPGDNPEFAPDTPENFQVITSGDDSIQLQWKGFDVRQLPRGTKLPTYEAQYSDDGVNWISIESTRNGVINLYGLEQYTEYLAKLRAVNEFGTSPFTVINSGIPTSEGLAETGAISSVRHSEDSQYVQFRWGAASWLFGYDLTGSIIEKSINYGNFTKLVDVGVISSGQYTDFEVEDGNVYSYRIQTTTTNEVHTRSGFNSILYTEYE